jgi:NTP pyrophosphatase (non-canonical NTP hydrolase)
MTPDKFMEEVLIRYQKSDSGDTRTVDARMLHGCMGVVTEAGELLDHMKRHIYYGQPSDIVNIAEECGDILNYVALVLSAQGLTFEDAMRCNKAKLTVRYGPAFDCNRAVVRDTKAERTAMEKALFGKRTV